MRTTLARRPRTLWNELLERRYGVRTSGEIPPERLGFPGSGPYLPSSWLVLRQVFKAFPVSRNDVFVDYGSGKGRVVVMAARKPFKRVLGVEQSEDLNRIARDNVERNRDRLRCQDVELVTSDAGEWPVPDDVTIAYFYCPFPPEVFERVIGGLLGSIDRRPRRVRVVYYFMAPRDREVMARIDRARPLEYRAPRPLRKRLSELWMYELAPS